MPNLKIMKMPIEPVDIYDFSEDRYMVVDDSGKVATADDNHTKRIRND